MTTSRWKLLQAALFLTLTFGVHAQVPISEEITVEIEPLSLTGSGPIPLGNGPGIQYQEVFSLVTLDVLAGSELTIGVAFELPDFSFSLPPNLDMTVTHDALVNAQITVSDDDLNFDFSGILNGQDIIIPAVLTGQSVDLVSLDFTGLTDLNGQPIPNPTFFDLISLDPNIRPVADFATIGVTITNQSISSDDLVFKQDLGEDVNGNLEEDFIEVVVDDIDLSFLPANLTVEELFALDENIAGMLPPLVILGQVADVSTDPPFGPIELTVTPAAITPEPATLALLGLGLIGLGFAKRRNAG